MKGVLVSLPFQDPSVPPFGIALLAAALSEAGLEYRVVDANLNFLSHMEEGIHFNPSHYGSAQEYLTAFRKLQQTLIQKTPEGSPFLLRPFQLNTEAWPDLHKLKSVAADPLWAQWLNAGIVDSILLNNPDWVGLSVCFEGQLPAALALGAALKGKTCVIFGGGLINAFSDAVSEQTPIWHATDAVIVGAGERLLSALRKTSNGIKPPCNALIQQYAQGWIARSAENLEPARRPHFDKMPLEKYRAAGRILPYRIFDRCHWRRCQFCADARYHAHFDRLEGNPERIAEELLCIQAKHKADGFYFLDAELPAQFLLSLAALLKGSHLRWGGNVRIEKALATDGAASILYDGGCRFLRFGLESASPNVLKAMYKGITPLLADRVLKSVAQSKIGVHVYLMQDFPGETQEDALLTKKFLLDHVDCIDSFNISTFALYEGAPLLKNIPPENIIRDVQPDMWTYPRFRLPNKSILSEEQIETQFYSLKGATRCFPTTADSIMLSERFLLDFTA